MMMHVVQMFANSVEKMNETNSENLWHFFIFFQQYAYIVN